MVAAVRERGGVVYDSGLSCFSKGCLSELHMWEQKVTPLGRGHCGAYSCAAHCFCISGLQDHCDLLAAAVLLFGI